MLDCSSGITAKRLAEYDSDPALKFLGQMDWGYTAGCPVWDSDLGDEFRQNFETEIPTVIVHGTWDTFTPFENATELVPYFKNGKFIAVNRGPHGAIRAAMRVSEPFRKGIMKFAATGDMSELPDSVDIHSRLCRVRTWTTSKTAIAETLLNALPPCARRPSGCTSRGHASRSPRPQISASSSPD